MTFFDKVWSVLRGKPDYSLPKKKAEEEPKLNMKWQWTKFIIVLALYLLFLYWVESWWGLIVVPFIYDVYISKKIKWQWWRKSESSVTLTVMSWVDAIVFALVAVYFINQFFFQNYVIPTCSLEKSLLVGDYLFVSKVSYGPRIPETPLTMPLTQHSLPTMFGVTPKSYIEWPHWEYRRVKGLGKIELNDIVVFNYPAGDTLLSAPRYSANDFYLLSYGYGYQLYPNRPNPDSISALERYRLYEQVYDLGRRYLTGNTMEFGEIMTRPTDRKENYVKRCVGLPGQTLQIKDRVIYLDGKENKEPDNAQFSYDVTFVRNAKLTNEFLEENHITLEDLGIMEYDQSMRAFFKSNDYITLVYNNVTMPLTRKTAEVLKQRKDLVESIAINTEASEWDIYPLNGNMHWTRDNYGPIWIPKKGETIELTLDNLPIYERPIRAYEKNDLRVTDDGKIFINGQEATSYTFKMDYYWMMGDNRHNSLDSRYWGFVPEDHIVGKPIFIWLSSDPDRSGFSGIRWNRLFRMVDGIK